MADLLYCKNCVMDGSDPDLKLDKDGVCNHCKRAQIMMQEVEETKKRFFEVRRQIKDDGEGKDYDVLIGLSGGIDSSMALYKAVEVGLRPYTFSVDNGYNDPKADENIMKMVEGLKVPFYRYNIDLVEFKNLQAAFMRAGVPNIEIPTDHILLAATYEMAEKNNIKWIISGGNAATESIMPPAWGYNARDLVHMEAIYGKKIEKLPTCSIWKWNMYRWDLGIKMWYILDYLDYNKKEAIKILKDNFDWQDYGDKHCENTFTTWFQNFYLYEKFGFDKRKAHYSSLINSGQMTRSEALENLKKVPVYPQFGFEGKVLSYPKHSHDDFPKDEKIYLAISKAIKELGWS